MKLAFVLAASLALATPAFAQQPATPQPPAQQTPEKAPPPVTVYTREQLRSQAGPPLELFLQREPARPGDGELRKEPYTGGGQLYPLTPASAQPPSSGIDWTKPVIGVDAPVSPVRAEDRATTIEIITTAEAKSVTVEEFVKNLTVVDTPLPPPCEPPVTKSPAAALPPPAPCPAPPR